MQEPTVIYEDDTVLLVNKPPQLVVNRAESVREPTLQDWVEKRDYWRQFDDRQKENLGPDFWQRSGIVHRLDKDTSGAIIIAKSEEAFREISSQFQSRTVEKEYLCLVHGSLSPKEGSLSLPISRSRFDREKFDIAIRGRSAQTSWKVLRTFSGIRPAGQTPGKETGFSYLLVKPMTGRTHQIRVHLNHLGHPVVGDDKYISRKRRKTDSLWCPRQFLHAYRIEFFHPRMQRRFQAEAELADDLKKCLDLLE